MGSPKELARMRQLFAESRPLFSALGNDERQELILIMLEGNNLSVGELAAHTKLSRPTVSHHLKILKDVCMVAPHKHGNKTIYCLSASDEHLASISELIYEAKRLTKRERQ